jgi:NAD(P)-dependent dehydrogenase (short-subunit alcohol dehydrogenase family)
MDLSLTNSVALVTGGSRGIGHAIALGPASSVILR